MCLTKFNIRTIFHSLGLLCLSVLLIGCGLGKGHGNLDAGSKYQASGQYGAAYIEAKKVLQRDSKNGNAWLLLGQASMMLGNPKDALSELQKAQENGVPEARWAVPMGRVLLVTQQFDELLKSLSPDQLSDPQVKAQVESLRGDAYRGLKQNDKAQQSYKAALALDPKEPGALLGLSKLATITNDTVSANKYVQQVLAESPENPQAWIAKGDLAFNSKDLPGAQSDYQKVLGFKNPDWMPQEHFYTLSRLANAQAQQNHMDEALASIETLEKIAPQHPYPRYLHAVVLYKQGHLDDATSQLQQVLKVSPNNPQAQMLMGAVNYAQGNFGQAEMFLSNVMGADQKNVEARKLLALTFYREGRSSQALDTLRPAVPGAPTDAALLALLQRVAAESANKPGAIAASADSGEPGAWAPATEPSHPQDAQFVQASKALASGNATETIQLLQKIPTGDADTEARRASLLAVAYVREKRPDDAVKTAAEYVSKNPQSSAAHLLSGTALIAAGKRDEARAEYSEAYKLDPKNIAALLSLGSLDTLEGHYKDAAGQYETVLKLDPQNAVAMTALGRLAMLQNDKAQAVKWLQQAIAAAPKSAAAYVGLVMLYSESGQFDEASNTARQFAHANPNDPAALNAWGAAELNAGHHSEALKPLQQAVNLAPQVPFYRTNLARAQILNKDTKAAEENLEKVIKADSNQLTALTLLAFMKSQNNDLAGAISLAQTLQQQPGTKAAGLSLEGDLYMANKSWSKAAQAYQQGLKIENTRPLVVKSFMALSESGASKPDGVLLDWLAKHPDDASTRLLLAQYYTGHAQNAAAATQYEQVLNTYPSNVDALNNLAWIYAEQHNPKALPLAERAHKLVPDSPGVADTYAWALIANNQPKAALPILQKAAAAAPKVPTIQYHLAVAQAHTGDKAAARTTLEALQKSGVDFQDKQAAEKLYHEVNGAGKLGS